MTFMGGLVLCSCVSLAELCELQVPRADSAPEFCLLLAWGKCDAGCKSWHSDTACSQVGFDPELTPICPLVHYIMSQGSVLSILLKPLNEVRMTLLGQYS